VTAAKKETEGEESQRESLSEGERKLRAACCVKKLLLSLLPRPVCGAYIPSRADVGLRMPWAFSEAAASLYRRKFTVENVDRL